MCNGLLFIVASRVMTFEFVWFCFLYVSSREIDLCISLWKVKVDISSTWRSLIRAQKLCTMLFAILIVQANLRGSILVWAISWARLPSSGLLRCSYEPLNWEPANGTQPQKEHKNIKFWYESERIFQIIIWGSSFYHLYCNGVMQWEQNCVL